MTVKDMGWAGAGGAGRGGGEEYLKERRGEGRGGSSGH